MKYLVITMPGAADHPAEELGGKTPLEVAKIPNLHHFTKIGKLGSVKLVPERFEPSSDTVFLNLLGYDADKVYTGRGPLEAANLDLALEDNEIPFRMNFITEAGGTLADPTAGRISTKEAKALINFLNKKVASDFVRFFSGAGYRHVAVLKDSHGFDALSAKTISPETIIGEPLDSNFPKGPGEELLKKLMYDARLLLQDHEINQVRVDLHENPANMIWLWGQGRPPRIEKFTERFGISGALVASMEYAKGIGRLVGLTVVELAEEIGEFDVDYEKVSRAVLDELEEKDFVCCHLTACDDASRMGDLKAKVSALEGMDFFFLSRVREYLESSKDLRILVTPGVAAPWKARKHVRDQVPYVIAGKNIMADEAEKFTELAAKSGEQKVSSGAELLPAFLSK